MERIVYVRLLEEGAQVYRPVPAIQVADSVYKLRGLEFYDPDNEVWEFRPGACVLVVERLLSGGVELVAVQEWNPI